MMAKIMTYVRRSIRWEAALIVVLILEIAFFGAMSEVDSEEIIRLSEWGNEGLEPDLTIVLDEQYPADEPAMAIRDAFIARRDAAVRGYAVLPPSSGKGLESGVLRHADAAVVVRRDAIRPVSAPGPVEAAGEDGLAG